MEPNMERRENMSRLEEKVDEIARAVAKLVLIEERQSTQSERIGRAEAANARLEGVVKTLDDSLKATDRKVDMWIQRGVAGWAVLATLFTLAKAAGLF